MLALYRSGRQADALRAYQTARRALRDELGLQPGQELRELEAAILRQDERLSFGGRAVDPAAPAAGERPAVTARRPRTALLVAAPLVALAVVAAVLVGRDDSAPVSVPPNSVAAIDPATNEVVTTVPVGPRPGPVTGGDGSLWVGGLEDRSLTRIDPENGRIVGTIGLSATPTGLAAGFDALWVAHGRSGQLSRVDPAFNDVTETLDLAGRAVYAPTGSVALGAGWVWVVFGKATLVRVDPATVRPSGSTLAGTGSADVVVANGSLWVSNTGDSNVQRFDPTTFEEGPLRPITVGRGPMGIAGGEGAVWVAIADDDVVIRIDPSASSILTIPVGDQPVDVAVGAGAVWVADRRSGTVSRIDPQTNEVVETIDVGNAPTGLAVAEGKVWVTVQAP
jgi:YVTN family beta-propeller protein